MRSSSTDELMGQFLAELSTLSVRANVAAKLRRAELVAGLATVDEGTSELQDKVMAWMDGIEASFRIIRRKLLS